MIRFWYVLMLARVPKAGGGVEGETKQALRPLLRIAIIIIINFDVLNITITITIIIMIIIIINIMIIIIIIIIIQALVNLKELLAAAGSSLENVVACSVSLADIKRDFAAMNGAYAAFFKKDPLYSLEGTKVVPRNGVS